MLDKDTKVIQGISTEIDGVKEERYINAKYWEGVEITDIKTIGNHSIFKENDSDDSNIGIKTIGHQSIFKTSEDDDDNIDIHTNSIIERTYSDLKIMIDKSELIPGVQYRITDYVTTTTQEDTKSAGKRFDIIVTADTKNNFSEIARVCLHKDDTYFGDSNLDAWEIKYCFENNTNRFAWADTTNGKGVIYYMKDEFNNECWYDFKNIQFLRRSKWFDENKNFHVHFDEDVYFYTFSAVENGIIYDDSLYSTNYHATDNHLGRSKAKITKLNNTIFIDKKNNGVFNNIIADGHYNNTFGSSIWNNTIGHNFTNNIIYKTFHHNNIFSEFEYNKIFGNFIYNTVYSGFTYNILNSSVHRNLFKQAFHKNISNGSLTSCTFGSDNMYIIDIPTMSNVTFGNRCFCGSDSSKISLNNLSTSNGLNLLSAIKNFKEECEYTILLCDNNKYDIFSHNTLDKISNIYDLGSFETSGEAEKAAKNTNICANSNINILKYYIPSSNKTGIIEQIVGDTSTTQIITWGGVRKVRTISLVSLPDGTISSTNITEFEELKILTTKEWNAINNEIDNINETINNIDPVIYSNPNLEFEDPKNNINSYGYVGTLENIGVSGDLILIDSIGVYVREGEPSPNPNTSVLCRLLKSVNGVWEVVYQSIESAKIGDFSPETLFSFKMKAIDKSNKLISLRDRIAIVYVDSEDEDADVLSCVRLGFKSIGVPGSLSNAITNESPGDHRFAPAFVIGYLSMASEKGGDIYNDICINNHNNNNQTIIRSDIDSGELKVFKKNENDSESESGFIIRTNGKFDTDIPKLELLGTNNYASYIYQFPELKNENDTDYVVVKTQLEEAINTEFYEIQENEKVTAVALNYLNESIDDINNNIIRKIIVDVTYLGIKEMIQYSELIPGMQYRITDYVTTTTQDDTESAGKRFDIIVTADTKNSLNEIARAHFNDSDYYFKENSSNLHAWKIWYCLDNDTERFAWADEENGKGVIYRMIDEWGNDCPYDFKNIRFKRKDKYLYTFSWEEKDGTILDTSVFGNNSKLTDYYNRVVGVYDNIIGKYIEQQYSILKPKQYLNNIVFSESYVYDEGNFNGCYSNTFGSNCHSNTFGNRCYSNIFYNNCSSNTFGSDCNSNTFGNDCYSNTFGNRCYSNTFMNACHNNTFGDYCYVNTFGNDCSSNKFVGNCNSNIFGNSCFSNKFGDGCHSNTFGNSCHSNKFVGNCHSNTFGNSCYDNYFGDYCYSNSFGNYCYSNEFVDYCYSNAFGNHCVSNIFGNEFGNDCNSNTFSNDCCFNIFTNVVDVYCNNVINLILHSNLKSPSRVCNINILPGSYYKINVSINKEDVGKIISKNSNGELCKFNLGDLYTKLKDL